MKKTIVWLMAVLMVCLTTSVAWAASDADVDAKEQAKIAKAQAKWEKEKAKIIKERAKIGELHDKALENLYAKIPSSQQVIKDAYAYATLSNTGTKLGIIGDAHGRGLAVNKTTGEKVYMRMSEMGIGLGLGVKEYDLIFVIETEEAWKSFTAGNTNFGAAAEAAVGDGKTSAAIEGATMAAKGVWVYQITKKGLTVDASIKGTRIAPYKKLNKDLGESKEVKF
ncbi:MAG: lipid-binding SYLF domain-containing protein [Selenomonadaceae bacterium]|nr:lipid-binding SYLF domain-containing protein [Selenomonadaceae bacterium]